MLTPQLRRLLLGICLCWIVGFLILAIAFQDWRMLWGELLPAAVLLRIYVFR
jgi:hypothetical protein